MDDLRKAAEMALGGLITAQETTEYQRLYKYFSECVEQLRQALAQPEQEPLAVLKVWDEKEQKHVFMNYHLTPPNKPEQEPVAWVRDLTSPSTHCVTSLKYLSIANTDAGVKYIPVYTVPPSKPWVGLENIDFQYQLPAEVITMKYAEAILKEKNK